MRHVDVGVRGPASEPDDSDQASIYRGISALAATWKLAAAIGLIALLLIGVSLVGLRSALPTTTTYLGRMQFTFPGAATGRFPSGDSFSLNEVIEPIVLRKVYEDLRIADYGIDVGTFMSGFYIRPFAPGGAEIGDRFRERLADRRITMAEREQIENQIRAELQSVSRTTAELGFVVRGRFGLPNEIGRAIVQAIPRTWSQIAINQRGALRLPGYSTAKVLIETDAVKQASLPDSIVQILDAAYLLGNRIRELSQADLFANVSPLQQFREHGVRVPLAPPIISRAIMTNRDPVSGKTLRDIERDFRELQTYMLTPLYTALMRDIAPAERERIVGILQRRIDELTSEELEANRNAMLNAEMIGQFIQAMIGLKAMATEPTKADQRGTVPGGVTTQLGESFINRIIELAGRSGDIPQQDYVALLSSQQIEFKKQAIALQGRRERFDGMLASLRENSAQQPTNERSRAEIAEKINLATGGINKAWEALNGLEVEFSNSLASHSSLLFVPFIVGRDVVWTHPVYNQYSIYLALSMAVLIFLLVWGARAFRHAWKQSRS